VEEKKTYTLKEVEEIVDKMARTMARLYYFMAKEVIDAYGEEAKEIIRQAVYKYGASRGEEIRHQVLSAGEPLTVANLGKYYDLPLHLAWRSTKARATENLLEKRVTYCPFAAQWQELAGEELGKIYCIQDLSLRKAYNPNFKFEQFTNVLNNDEDCHTILSLDEKE
jgi:hypothetical protein